MDMCRRATCGDSLGSHRHHGGGAGGSTGSLRCAVCDCPRYLPPARPRWRTLTGWPLTVAAAVPTGGAAALVIGGYQGPAVAWLAGAALVLLWAGYALTGGETPR